MLSVNVLAIWFQFQCIILTIRVASAVTLSVNLLTITVAFTTFGVNVLKITVAVAELSVNGCSCNA